MLNFLNGLDEDLRKALIAQLRNLWTHGSTAIEGNTLTLGETAFVIEEGLTVSGKPIKDHQEVLGHAHAIDLIYDMVERASAIGETDLFLLHQAVQTTVTFDAYKPIGAWKKEPNGTYMVAGDKQIFYEYADPSDVPVLMKKWIGLLNQSAETIQSKEDAAAIYAKLHMAFVWVHPFFDANGRMARLTANIPVLQCGFPPILIPKAKRWEYILHLSEYKLAEGSPKASTDLLPINAKLNKFIEFCKESWAESLDLVETIRQKQKERDA